MGRPTSSAPQGRTTARSATYQSLTPRMAWLLAAPHTWAASIMPVLVAMAAACANQGHVSIILTLVVLLISVLMQSAVNTLNDYFDYVKGTDSKEDNVEVDDAVLIYNNVNPKSALRLAIGFLVAAFALGVVAIIAAGWIPLVIALIGALVVFLYSGGKTPISYLPIGELVSGFVMGGLILLASYQVLTCQLDWFALIWALPVIINIGLIMMTNNTCDIEKDLVAERKTLPVLLGREKSRTLYHVLMYLSLLLIVIIDAIWFTNGLLVMPIMLASVYPFAKNLLANPLVPASRIPAMGQVCTFNVVVGTFYALSLLLSAMPLTLM